MVRVYARHGRAHEEGREQQGVQAETCVRAVLELELELAGRDPRYLRAVPDRHAGDVGALPGAQGVVRVLLPGRADGAELVVAPLELPELVRRV